MPPLAYFKKQFVPISECKVSIMTHALHYGTAAFEGIRGNWNEEEEQVYLFRIEEHYRRMFQSCKIVRIKLPHSLDELCRLTKELVSRSGYKEDCYVRPFAYKCSEVIGPRLYNLEDDFFLTVTTFGPYLNVDKGAKAMVSTWRRMDDLIAPPRAKVAGVYINSAMAKTEAHENGYDEAILLSMDGHVSEGSGQNIILVIDGKIVTPTITDNILKGITRDTVLTLVRQELGLETVERPVDRSELYIAEEAFFCGTASHLTPIIDVDHYPVGNGEVGPITTQLRKLYFDVIRGKHPKYKAWCTPALAKTVKA
ncbi:MAG: branched-chain amino acid transaminase [Chloroflexota bacterium]